MSDQEFDEIYEALQGLRKDGHSFENIKHCLNVLEENEAEDAWCRDQEAKIRNHYSA